MLSRLLALLLTALLLGTACNDDDPAVPLEEAGEATFPMSFRDSGGFTVEVKAPPQRIVSLSASMTETLFAIGVGSKVVGVDRFSDYPEAARPLATLEYSRPAPEPVLALAPDLVIMSGRQAGQVDQFRAVGLSVAFLEEPATLDGVYANIRLIGRITNHASAANDIASDMQARAENVVKQVTALEGRLTAAERNPSVFWELTPDGFTAGTDSFIGSLIKLVHGRNVAEGATTAFPQLSTEAIIAADPQVIILTDAIGGESPATVRARPGWGMINAVRNNRVHPVDANVFSRPGPRIIDAMEQLAKFLYPALVIPPPQGR
jgi:iron complex transport system substrate-binding protein